MSNETGNKTGPKKVRVRIAVLVGADGSWVSQGWPCPLQRPRTRHDSDMMATCFEQSESPGGTLEYFVEAELEVPEVKTVEGTEGTAEKADG